MFTTIFKAIARIFFGSPPPQEPTQQQPSYQKPPAQAHSVPYPPPYQYKPPTSAAQKPPRPQKLPYQGDNNVNQENEYYKSLRARANEEGDRMAQCFQQAPEAYARNEKGIAKELSNQGKEHQRKMDELNKKASDWIFQENNRDSNPGEIDLHGLYVKEAISRTEEALETAQRRGQSELKLIVGKGLHSQNGAKLKPAIETLMKKYRLDAELDPYNAGVLVVRLGYGRHSRMGPEEISRRIERSDESCVIM